MSQIDTDNSSASASKQHADVPSANRLRYAGLLVVLLTAALFRLGRMDLIEFKADESMACDLTVHMLEQRELATRGMTSGVGLANFPLFIYLMAPLVAISRDPVFLTGAIAAVNLIAVGLIYYCAARRWGTPIAFWTTLLMATSPWAVLYSRKIWSQNLLPVLAAGSLFGLLAILDGKHKRILAILMCAGSAMMVHFSGVCLILVVVLCLNLYRPRVDGRQFGIALALLIAMASPFVYYLCTDGRGELSRLREIAVNGRGHDERPTSLAALAGLSFDLVNDFGFGTVLGETPGSSAPPTGTERIGSVAGRATLLIGLFAAVLRVGRSLLGKVGTSNSIQRRRDDVVLLLWIFVPILVYRLAGVRVPHHYFIITFPAPFLMMAFLLEDIRHFAGRMRSQAPRLGLQAIPVVIGIGLAISGTRSMVTMANSIDRQGGAPGDYGVVLREKVAAVEFMMKSAGDWPVRLVADPQARTMPRDVPEYFYLLRTRHDPTKRAGLPGAPAAYFAVFDLFRVSFPAEQVESLMRDQSARKFGPVLVLPVRPSPPMSTESDAS